MEAKITLLKLVLDELGFTEECKTLDDAFYETVRSIAKDMKEKGINHIMYSECGCQDCDFRTTLYDDLNELRHHLTSGMLKEYTLHPQVKRDVQEYKKSESFQKIISSLHEHQTP